MSFVSTVMRQRIFISTNVNDTFTIAHLAMLALGQLHKHKQSIIYQTSRRCRNVFEDIPEVLVGPLVKYVTFRANM